MSRERHGRDLNGDGYDDLAAYDKDRINIVYGSPHGLDPRTRTTVRACLLKPPSPLPRTSGWCGPTSTAMDTPIWSRTSAGGAPSCSGAGHEASPR
nr:hypothetical protein [Streptomyces antimycoticus]